MRARFGNEVGRVTTASEFTADKTIHLAGIVLGIGGTVVLVAAAFAAVNRSVFYASLIYSSCLLGMLLCSAVYNLAVTSPRRQFLRRLDHAAIFLIIAGTYTPFTICRLHGAWAVGMTAAVWAGAIAGAVTKLASPRRIERFSVGLYLALGWLIVVGIRPLLAAVEPTTAMLIFVGGILYSIGARIHLWRSLPYHNAIWHGLVLLAAGCHYGAILYGVVLTDP
jgi:hemolysin III